MPGRELRVLGISGSLRRDSYNSRLLELASLHLPGTAEYRRYAGLKAVPPFDEDDEVPPYPAAVADLREQIRWADGLLVSTPEYNASVPGQLKNAVDWASRPVASAALRGKAVAVVGASTSAFGAVWAQAHLRAAFGAAGARVIDRELAVAMADEQLATEGGLADPDLAAQLGEVVDALVAELRLESRLRAEREASATDPRVRAG
ncbi:MAG: NAD(P)H-dependent oxidoreductase [Pseudonocardiales bacterium]|nr:NAD(P)H-dependent oxidoreductase [Pseudonocardiales bacterium]